VGNLGADGRIILKCILGSSKDGNWIELAQDRVQCQTFVDTVLESLRFLKLRKALHHEVSLEYLLTG
jgi:hypothetical protein